MKSLIFLLFILILVTSGFSQAMSIMPAAEQTFFRVLKNPATNNFEIRTCLVQNPNSCDSSVFGDREFSQSDLDKVGIKLDEKVLQESRLTVKVAAALGGAVCVGGVVVVGLLSWGTAIVPATILFCGIGGMTVVDAGLRAYQDNKLNGIDNRRIVQGLSPDHDIVVFKSSADIQKLLKVGLSK